MRLCDVVDKFLDQHCLANTGTPKKANLAPTSIGSKKVHNFDAGLKNLSSGRLVNKRRRFGMNWLASNALNWATLINGFTNDVHDAAQGVATHGDLDGRPSVNNFLTPNETLGTIHGNGTDRVFAQVGRDLKN
jgi:hypothetical protein